MTNSLAGHSYEHYEEAFTIFEEAQSLLLSGDDIEGAARTAASFALIAREVGNVSMAEAGHRTAIHAYRLIDETEALKLEPGLVLPVNKMILAEYARLAETMGTGHRGVTSHRRLSGLRREILGLGPVAAEDVSNGIWALHETENGLATLAVFGRQRHHRKARRLYGIGGATAMYEGLGLKILVEGDISPRSMREWIKTINKPSFD